MRSTVQLGDSASLAVLVSTADCSTLRKEHQCTPWIGVTSKTVKPPNFTPLVTVRNSNEQCCQQRCPFQIRVMSGRQGEALSNSLKEYCNLLTFLFFFFLKLSCKTSWHYIKFDWFNRVEVFVIIWSRSLVMHSGTSASASFALVIKAIEKRTLIEKHFYITRIKDNRRRMSSYVVLKWIKEFCWQKSLFFLMKIILRLLWISFVAPQTWKERKKSR